MAVVLEAFDVVLLVEAIERNYPGGLVAFRDAAPNGSFCSDGDVCRLSFMNELDRAQFVLRLEPVGLTTRDGIALVRADEDFENEHLRCGRYASVRAAWKIGGALDPLVVPLGYRPDSVFFQLPDDVAEHLEYVGRRGGVETYRDRRTGRELYVGRTEPELDPEVAERMEDLRREGVALLQPFLGTGGPRPKPGFFQKRKIRKGIALLDQVLATVPNHASSLWIIGMALRTLREHEQALEYLRRAHIASPTQPDMGREYAGQCMILGQGEEAVRVSKEIAKRHPEDVSLLSNLGLAHLIAGEVDEALRVATEAHDRDPNDPITKNLVGFIRDVKAGKRERPKTLPGDW